MTCPHLIRGEGKSTMCLNSVANPLLPLCGDSASTLNPASWRENRGNAAPPVSFEKRRPPALLHLLQLRLGIIIAAKNYKNDIRYELRPVDSGEKAIRSLI